MVDKFKINGAVARKTMREFCAKGLIKQVGDHHAGFTLYTGTQSKVVEKGPEGAAPEKGKKQAPKAVAKKAEKVEKEE